MPQLANKLPKGKKKKSTENKQATVAVLHKLKITLMGHSEIILDIPYYIFREGEKYSIVFAAFQCDFTVILFWLPPFI